MDVIRDEMLKSRYLIGEFFDSESVQQILYNLSERTK
jgi:hypothetical protein